MLPGPRPGSPTLRTSLRSRTERAAIADVRMPSRTGGLSMTARQASARAEQRSRSWLSWRWARRRLLRPIRSRPCRGDLRCLRCNQERIEAMQSGALDYHEGPFSAADIVAILDTFVPPRNGSTRGKALRGEIQS